MIATILTAYNLYIFRLPLRCILRVFLFFIQAYATQNKSTTVDEAGMSTVSSASFLLNLFWESVCKYFCQSAGHDNQ